MAETAKRADAKPTAIDRRVAALWKRETPKAARLDALIVAPF